MRIPAMLALLSVVGCGSNLTTHDQMLQAQTERCLQICAVKGPLSAADAEEMAICDRKIGKCK
jgi:predicted small lipoprotein YifL